MLPLNQMMSNNNKEYEKECDEKYLKKTIFILMV